MCLVQVDLARGSREFDRRGHLRRLARCEIFFIALSFQVLASFSASMPSVRLGAGSASFEIVYPVQRAGTRCHLPFGCLPDLQQPTCRSIGFAKWTVTLPPGNTIPSRLRRIDRTGFLVLRGLPMFITVALLNGHSSEFCSMSFAFFLASADASAAEHHRAHREHGRQSKPQYPYVSHFSTTPFPLGDNRPAPKPARRRPSQPLVCNRKRATRRTRPADERPAPVRLPSQRRAHARRARRRAEKLLCSARSAHAAPRAARSRPPRSAARSSRRAARPRAALPGVSSHAFGSPRAAPIPTFSITPWRSRRASSFEVCPSSAEPRGLRDLAVVRVRRLRDRAQHQRRAMRRADRKLGRARYRPRPRELRLGRRRLADAGRPALQLGLRGGLTEIRRDDERHQRRRQLHQPAAVFFEHARADHREDAADDQLAGQRRISSGDPRSGTRAASSMVEQTGQHVVQPPPAVERHAPLNGVSSTSRRAQDGSSSKKPKQRDQPRRAPARASLS